MKEFKSWIGPEDEQLIDQELDRLFPERLIRRVLLISPPDVDVTIFDYSMAKRGRCWNFPPYGLGIIASHIRNDTIRVKIINLNSEVLKACILSNSNQNFNFDEVWKTKLFKEIAEFQPDLIAVSCMFTQTHNSIVKLCNEIRYFRPNLPIALGGVHVTNSFMDDKTSNVFLNDLNTVDIFFLYEAELAFKQFISVVNQEASVNKLYQVCLNSYPEMFYFSTKKNPVGTELDIIPAYDLMVPTDSMDYGVIGSFFCLKDKGTKVATILSNRGCRGQCTYCSVRSFNGRGVRHRSVESVIDELIELREKYSIDHVMWLDDDFLHDTQRTIRLFDEMITQNVGITWDCTNGVIASSCTDEIIAAAAKSGCIGLNIGVESGNPQILKRIKKPGNIDTFLKAAEVLRKYEQINTRVFLMIGFPGETYRMIHDTFNLAMAMDLDWYNITIFEPLPNTPMFDLLAKKEYIDQNVFENIRYNSGPYGKTLEKLHKNILQPNCENVFNNVNLDMVIPKSQMEDIWFYINYHLNFEKLFKENRLSKLEQQLKYVQYITDFVAPEDPFPMYFCGYLQKRVLGNIDLKLVNRLKKRIQTSKYWDNKFKQFNLSPKDLITESFQIES